MGIYCFSIIEHLWSVLTGLNKGAFSNCKNLTEVIFCGTEAEWNAVKKGTAAFNNVSSEFHIVFMEQ